LPKRCTLRRATTMTPTVAPLAPAHSGAARADPVHPAEWKKQKKQTKE
jgi:hypothetical protein